MSVLNTPPAKATGVLTIDDRTARLLVWLGELIQKNGPGEYIVRIGQDGQATVKRPQKPLEFHYGG